MKILSPRKISMFCCKCGVGIYLFLECSAWLAKNNVPKSVHLPKGPISLPGCQRALTHHSATDRGCHASGPLSQSKDLRTTFEQYKGWVCFVIFILSFLKRKQKQRIL